MATPTPAMAMAGEEAIFMNAAQHPHPSQFDGGDEDITIATTSLAAPTPAPAPAPAPTPTPTPPPTTPTPAPTLPISDRISIANTPFESFPSHPHSTSHSNSYQPRQSHFPTQTLSRTSISEASARADEELLGPDAARALADLRPIDAKMNPPASGHRRRRSSMMINVDTTSRVARSKRSPISSTIGGDSKSAGRVSEDDSRSTSDDMELNNFSEEGDLQDDEETGLTAKSRAKRKKKKIKNQSINHRIAGDIIVTADEKNEADWNVVKKSLMNGVLIGLWYIFSLSISIVSSLFPLADISNPHAV
ncbi:hypothetical protein DSL72_005431 [Monilinia vaccinii-corymbosi]|uniref:Uncharacterized protein n=1 Tax=Monilinia vaccinii-corymbosi TaxID=61207 RepID=A0A8A3PFC2_9HELO|nr:hypothetical protein DSL72_005431 [Monilinia vaccinii-corymbosi]